MQQKIQFIILTALLPLNTVAQNPLNISGNLRTEAFFSSDLPAPMWFTARQEGRWGLINQNQFTTLAQVSIQKQAKGGWNFAADAEIDYNTAINRVYLHHGFMKIDWRFLNLMAGRHTFSPIFGKNYKGSGSYLFGDNNRPIDRVTFAISEYTAVPFTRRVLEVRGGISHGWLDDTKHYQILSTEANYYHRKILLHEKYAYARFNFGKLKVYGGLNHSAFMGGYSGKGVKIPIDYWKSIFAKSSTKIGRGDATNAGGAHMGLYDFGIYTTLPFGDAQFYYQLPFADKSGMLFWKRNQDQMTGINVSFNNCKWLHNLTFEWVNTAYQTGNGVPDAIIVWPDTGVTEGMPRTVLITKTQAELDEMMHRLLGDAAKTGYTFDEVNNYLRSAFNRGREHGGRDGYMNNGDYPGGWTYYGMVMGSPLNLTRDRLHHLNPILGRASDNYYVDNFIANDRYRALHVGGEGSISDKLSWEAMFTFSVNYGSYYNQYPGRYTWEETPNYYFAHELKQFYSLLALAWKPCSEPNITFNIAAALDAGEIFNTFGGKFGVKWSF
ncbi:MAG: capsule assembly Wzi family protein [Cytophagaceae bacterium]|jgi:hypothetical protein|nr:capsule assembly Wzi family protein [Cytophagaceae bacterium]